MGIGMIVSIVAMVRQCAFGTWGCGFGYYPTHYVAFALFGRTSPLYGVCSFRSQACKQAD